MSDDRETLLAVREIPTIVHCLASSSAGLCQSADNKGTSRRIVHNSVAWNPAARGWSESRLLQFVLSLHDKRERSRVGQCARGAGDSDGVGPGRGSIGSNSAPASS
jgi:hypothetical protein